MNLKPETLPLKTQVLIIGGGITGAGIARDLALRGVSCVLVEKDDINAGASGSNHGLLHSGARYVANDPATAMECRDEARLLKRLAPHCVEDTGGLFVAVEGDDEAYVADFEGMCARSGLNVRKLDTEDARRLEPVLSPNLMAAFATEDAAVDPFRLSHENIAQALSLGTVLMCRTRVTGFEMSGRRIRSVHMQNGYTGELLQVEADQVINAAGAWAAKVAALAGITIPVYYAKGTLLVAHDRITDRVINRLRPPGDGDILVPGGTVSLLGTTSERISDPDRVAPAVPEVDRILDEASRMIPSLDGARFIRAYAGVRPLIDSGQKEEDGRGLSRGHRLWDHARDGVDNLATIAGGKLTTFRLMAEDAADLVCARMGISAVCRTGTEPLPESSELKWSEPGLSGKLWVKRTDPEDTLLCECEMVSKSAVDSITDAIRRQSACLDLRAIGSRSRIGKGACQGSFCSVRVTAHRYDRGELRSDRGVADLSDFLRERWKGMHPILWGGQLMHAELREALHCGVFNLELEPADQEKFTTEAQSTRR